jgi:NTP pyrophosphatase (non-canonical NTP hydrolase)
MDLELIKTELRAFVEEREWSQFHSPENLAKSIAIEASELLECFQWGSNAEVNHVKQELADVLIYCLLLGDKYDLALEEVILEKIEINKQKYPIGKAKGKSDKYDRL